MVSTATVVVPPDVAVRSTNDLPFHDLPPDCELDVYYAEQIIAELGTVGELVETYHSGLIFRCRSGVANNKGGSVVQGAVVPAEFTLQWYALDFPFGAFLPQIQEEEGSDNSRLLWTNTACAHYTAGVDPDRWTKGVTLVGRITGGGGNAFDSFAQWTVQYCKDRPGYQAFEVWDRPSLVPGRTVRWAASNTCSTFTEAALIKLYELGADFKNGGRALLRRSYVPLISKDRPTKVDMNDEDEAKAVREFYGKTQEAVVSQRMSTAEFIRFLGDKLDFFYVYDSNKDGVYLRVELSRPYVALTQLYQPMCLPWQLLDQTGNGVADDRLAEFAEGEDASFLADLSAAVEGSVDLLKRRLPTVVKRKLGPTLLPIVVVAAAALVVPVATMLSVGGSPRPHTMDYPSFVTGLLVGLAAGLLIPSRFLSGQK